MMIVTPLETQIRGRRALPAGQSVAVYDINAGEMLLAGECHVEQVEPLPLRPWERGMRALLTRPGGYGDLLFLTPAITALAALGVEVHVCRLHKSRNCSGGCARDAALAASAISGLSIQSSWRQPE